MVIYIGDTLEYMFQKASVTSEEAMMEFQALIHSGELKETQNGYKYLVVEDNEEDLNDKQDETI